MRTRFDFSRTRINPWAIFVAIGAVTYGSLMANALFNPGFAYTASQADLNIEVAQSDCYNTFDGTVCDSAGWDDCGAEATCFGGTWQKACGGETGLTTINLGGTVGVKPKVKCKGTTSGSCFVDEMTLECYRGPQNDTPGCGTKDVNASCSRRRARAVGEALIALN